ncbi:MAG: Tfp pilus assembly PilM family ATPase [Candidatus Omnitrophota bacterium]|jgi:Tfp pilus assembly PilM family ATPase
MNLFPKPTTLIYMDESTFKVAVTMEGSGSVSSVHSFATEGLSSEQYISDIKQSLELCNANLSNVHLVISSQYAVTKSIEVPSFDADELSQIVSLQAGRHTPLSSSEFVVDYLNLDIIADKYTKVLLAIVANADIQKHAQLLEQAGCEIQGVHTAFDLVTKGLVRTMCLTAAEHTGIVILDVNNSDMIIAYKDQPVFIRTMPVGIKNITQPNNQAILLDEIIKSHEAYKAAEGSVSLQKIVVIGPQGFELQALSQAINEKLVIPTRIISARETITLKQAAQTYLEECPTLSLDDILFGCASPSLSLMNFLPQELKTQKVFKAKAKSTFTAGILVILTFMCFVGTYVSQAYFKSAYLKSIESKFATRDIEANKLMNISIENHAIAEFKNRKNEAVSAILELEKILPTEMYLNEVIIEPSGLISIRGTSTLMSRVFAFVSEFENSVLFSDVTTDFAKSRKSDEQDVTDFGLSATIDKGAISHGR